MALIKVDPIGMEFNTRKRESFQISEKVWRENNKIKIKLASMDSPIIADEFLVVGFSDKKLAGNIHIHVNGVHKLVGSGHINIKKPGREAFVDMNFNNKNFISRPGQCGHSGSDPAVECWFTGNLLEDKGTLYNQELFLKNYLEEGFVTVEICSDIGVNRENVEDKRIKRTEAVVRDINNFCSDESSCDFIVMVEGEEIPCHKIILCSRCPVIADGLAANMCEESLGRWTVTDSNPEAVKDMLHFLYTGEIQGVKTRPTELLHLATFYRLPELETASKEELIRQLTAGNAVKTLVNMDKFAADDVEVKEKVIGFIKKNARDVVEGEDWQVFVNNYGYLVTDIFKAMVN